MTDSDEIKQMLISQNAQMKRIEFALLGDQQMKQKGIVHKVDDLEVGHKNLKRDYYKHRNTFLWVASFIGGVITLAAQWIWKKVSGE
jgi:hypothetical protein